MLKRKKLFGIKIVVSNPAEAVRHVVDEADTLKGGYISFANAHTTVLAHEDREFHRIQMEAAYVMPDGRPLSKLLRLRGASQARQIAGPDFMERLWEATKDGTLSHYFYGGSKKTIDALREKLAKDFPMLKIVGMESPPYRPLTEEEERETIARINDSGANFIWIGLGAPKQEYFMNAHKDMLCGVMLGVGAGFDFQAGTVKRAPEWMQKHYLEWLYRFAQEPARLWKRYVVTNIKFIGMVMYDRRRRRKADNIRKMRDFNDGDRGTDQ